MTVGEMIDYLKDFDRDLPLLMAALDPPARIIYPVTKVVVFTDWPGFGLEVTKGEPFDEDLPKAAEADETKEVPDAASETADPS